MTNILKTITDIASIIFPALIAIFGVLNLTGAIQATELVEQVILITLGALTAIASLLYNKLTKGVSK
jgi:hypothetical protein